ncbi:unnamed protein product [Ambrosiozyma monospora]|uniref:Unnamed protein product n=1 Tax=Ambrosiozyma monospora TaxID=43982 RepID=A0A9W6YU64_AMBMO|nr:unnamed protein product [Ambrosiozyma monospora]
MNEMTPLQSGTTSSPKTNRAIKVVLLGNQSVGKTSIRSQFVHRYFSTSYKATIGADFLSYRIRTKDQHLVTLQIWDTAGQERFNAVSKAFYRGADIAILVYDITNPESFYDLSMWLDNFIMYCNNSRVSLLLVGNKLDNSTIRQISFRQAVEFANLNLVDEGLIDDLKQDVLETSAKNYHDVEKLFKRCGELGYRKLTEDTMTSLNFDSVDVGNPLNRQHSKSSGWFSCC